MLPDYNTHSCSVCVSRFAANCVMLGWWYCKVAVFGIRRRTHVPVLRKDRFRASSGDGERCQKVPPKSLVAICQNTRCHRGIIEHLKALL
jgi:hypothetical protein